MTTLVERTAANVAQLLADRNLSHRRAAQTLGISRRTLEDKLAGRTRFSLDDVELIVERLHISVAQLLEPPALLVDVDEGVAS